jgi:hypothetical protein
MKAIFLRALPHVVAVVVFAIIANTFFSLIGDEYALKQPDIEHVMGMAKETADYRLIHKEEALWSNNMFGGMPAYQTNVVYPSNFLRTIDKVVKVGISGMNGILFMCMLGFYVFTLCVRVRPWLGIAAAIAFGLSTINILYIGAGHTSKVNAIAYMAPALGGLLLAYRGRWILGSAVFALFTGLHFAANHLQMTYYLVFLLGAVALTEVIRLIVQKQTSYALKTSGLLIVATMLALAPNTGSLMTTYEYSKLTTRGQSELTMTHEGAEKDAADSKGLKSDYILEYNMAAGEQWSMIIPNAKGGSSMVRLSDNKEAMQQVNRQVRENMQSFPQYWGAQGASAGAFYFGAAMMFLFVVALFFSKDVLKWPFLLLSILAIALSMKSMHGLNDFFINHFPMYNKFRDSKMMLVLIQVMAPALGILFLDQILRKEWNAANRKPYLIGVGALFVVYLIVAFNPTITGSLISPMETEYLAGLQEQYKAQPEALQMIQSMEDALIDARTYIFTQDAQRSLLWIAIAVGLLIAIAYKKANVYIVASVLALVMAVDLWGVSSRYVNEDKWKSPATGKQEYRYYTKLEDMLIPYTPDVCDNTILDIEKGKIENFEAKSRELFKAFETTKPYSKIKNKQKIQYAADFGALNLNSDYRVLLASPGVFSEANVPYFHKSIGGYHAAKLKIYQEVIDFYLRDEIATLTTALQSRSMPTVDSAMKELQLVNMLNTRYIKYAGEAPPLDNSANAFGNAWFVNNIDYVPTADAEMAALGKTDLRSTAVVRENFKDIAKAPSAVDSTATITLTEYATKRLTFTSKSNVAAPVVFSEIYYPEGWICRVDGQEVPVFRANYILRGIEVPAGEHTIEWSFEPASYKKGVTVNYIGSISLLIFVLGAFALNIKSVMTSKED